MKCLKRKISQCILPLLSSILGQSSTSTRQMQIYMEVRVLLLRFKYPATLNKILREM